MSGVYVSGFEAIMRKHLGDNYENPYASQRKDDHLEVKTSAVFGKSSQDGTFALGGDTPISEHDTPVSSYDTSTSDCDTPYVSSCESPLSGHDIFYSDDDPIFTDNQGNVLTEVVAISRGVFGSNH